MSADDTRLILEHFDDKFAVLMENLETPIDNRFRELFMQAMKPINDELQTHHLAISDHSCRLNHIVF